MKKAKKIIALVLVLALSISLLSTVAFAEEIGGGDVEKKPYTVLFFGDQSIAGDSYAVDFTKYVQQQVGAGYEVTGKTANIIAKDGMNLPDMRNCDLYAAIRPPKTDVVLRLFDIDNPAPTIDNYSAKIFGKTALDDTDLVTLREELLGVKNKEVISGMPDSAVPTADPSVKTIVLDLTRNDLTGYLVERLMDVIENAGKTDREYTYALDNITAFPTTLVSDVNNALLTGVMVALNEYLSSAVYPELADQISAAVQYTALNFCLGFTETVAALKYWYPTAKLIVVGASNELKGLKITVPDTSKGAKADATTRIDVGYIYGLLANFANFYMTDLTGKYQLNNTYYYADVSNGVETIWQAADKDGNDKEEFKAAVAADIAERIGKALDDTAIGEFKNSLVDAGIITQEQTDDALADIIGITALPENVVKAAATASFDVTALDIPLNINTLIEAIKVCTDSNHKLTPAENAILGLYGLIAGDSFSTLPSADAGQAAKYEAVKEAYHKLLPANQDGEDAAGDFFLDGLVGVLNVFKSDILNAINNFFNNVFDGGLFSRIGDFFRGIFQRG